MRAAGRMRSAGHLVRLGVQDAACRAPRLRRASCCPFPAPARNTSGPAHGICSLGCTRRIRSASPHFPLAGSTSSGAAARPCACGSGCGRCVGVGAGMGRLVLVLVQAWG
eukprot:56514-Chlamydomonas_euryale.AAC.1